MNDTELAEKVQRILEGDTNCQLSLPEWQQIIAALRRGPERPPSGAMVMVPRTFLEAAKCPACDGSGGIPYERGPNDWQQIECQWCSERGAMLSAAESRREEVVTPQMSEPAPYICYACANGRHSDCQEEVCKCSHRAQPSRPAAPESETPEVDVQFKATEAIAEITPAAIAFVKLARSLERRLSLAQTEIKGHMRVEDELKARIASLERKLDDIVQTMKHAGMKVPGWIEHTDQDGKLRRDNLTIAATLMFELEAWQARIAELEKALRHIVTAREFDDLEPDDGLHSNSVRKFVTAALKSRA